MQLTTLKTLGELKKAQYQVKPIKQELKDNLISILSSGKNPFPNIGGTNTDFLVLSSNITQSHFK